MVIQSALLLAEKGPQNYCESDLESTVTAATVVTSIAYMYSTQCTEKLVRTATIGAYQYERLVCTLFV